MDVPVTSAIVHRIHDLWKVGELMHSQAMAVVVVVV